jgi:hypothetical protein
MTRAQIAPMGGVRFSLTVSFRPSGWNAMYDVCQ